MLNIDVVELCGELQDGLVELAVFEFTEGDELLLQRGGLTPQSRSTLSHLPPSLRGCTLHLVQLGELVVIHLCSLVCLGR